LAPHRRVDLPLLIIGLLLAATLATFGAGMAPYPYGWLVLTALLVARILYLQGRS
jgi:dihydroxy-acid dehydratase